MAASSSRGRDLGRRVARRLVPHTRRTQLRAAYNRATWRLHAGSNVTCNCCDGHFRHFRVYVGSGGFRSLMCPRCGSLPRHRAYWLYLTSKTDVLQHPTKLLHVAPEPSLAKALRQLPTISYLSADYDSSLAMEHVDVRHMQYADARFDGIICNHVLNFIDDDRAAMSELHRVLKPGGWALLQSMVNTTLELTVDNDAPDVATTDDTRYEEIFMRTYGRDYVTQLEHAGFTVTVSDFVPELLATTRRELALDDGANTEKIYFCRRPA